VKPLLVGESNPYQTTAADADRYALYPQPPNASGGRLCRFVMGLNPHDYLRMFDRVDLCHPRWSIRAARDKAAQLVAERDTASVIVLCGAKVAAAFGVPSQPFRIHHPRANHPRLVVLPHPSGLCRTWHEPKAVEGARWILRQAGVLPFEEDAAS